MEQFKCGDVVIIKGHSTKMTVEFVNEDNNDVKVVWFDSEDCLHRASLNSEALEKVKVNERGELLQEKKQ